MVRCSKCHKSFKQHTGECWNFDMCRKCWNKNDDDDNETFQRGPINTRLTTTPFDFYLDQYVIHELQNIDN